MLSMAISITPSSVLYKKTSVILLTALCLVWEWCHYDQTLEQEWKVFSFIHLINKNFVFKKGGIWRQSFIFHADSTLRCVNVDIPTRFLMSPWLEANCCSCCLLESCLLSCWFWSLARWLFMDTFLLSWSVFMSSSSFLRCSIYR